MSSGERLPTRTSVMRVTTVGFWVAFGASLALIVVLNKRSVSTADMNRIAVDVSVELLPTRTTDVPGITKHVLCARIPGRGGRLGNYMFIHAATLGIAYSLNYTPLIDYKNNPLPAVFKISTRRMNDSSSTNWNHFTEKDASKYDSRVRSLPRNVNQDLKGFFQSWKYFADPEIQKRIRDEFTFREPILDRAKAFLRNVTESYWMASNRSRNLSGLRSQTNHTQRHLKLIGIHVRRGDLISHVNKAIGYLVAPASYLRKAIEYFERRYSGADLMFVLCSDSIQWAKDNVKSASHPVVVSESGQVAVDLAILSLCDDVIMTVGTFGWWAAWLAGGVTLYWNGSPKPSSYIAKHFLASDYYPPNWIGMAA